MEKINRFSGPIACVRLVEDSIRATRQYTEGIFTRRAAHPIQGQDFPSKVFVKHYEVYPDLDLDKKRSLWEAIDKMQDWLWQDTLCVSVLFRYDYRSYEGVVEVKGGTAMIAELTRGIPGFGDALSAISQNGHKDACIREQS